jgi:hypothetical protein
MCTHAVHLHTKLSPLVVITPLHKHIALRAIPPLLVQPLVVQAHTSLTRRGCRCTGRHARRTVPKQTAAHRTSVADSLCG